MTRHQKGVVDPHGGRFVLSLLRREQLLLYEAEISHITGRRRAALRIASRGRPTAGHHDCQRRRGGLRKYATYISCIYRVYMLERAGGAPEGCQPNEAPIYGCQRGTHICDITYMRHYLAEADCGHNIQCAIQSQWKEGTKAGRNTWTVHATRDAREA